MELYPEGASVIPQVGWWKGHLEHSVRLIVDLIEGNTPILQSRFYVQTADLVEQLANHFQQREVLITRYRGSTLEDSYTLTYVE